MRKSYSLPIYSFSSFDGLISMREYGQKASVPYIEIEKPPFIASLTNPFIFLFASKASSISFEACILSANFFDTISCPSSSSLLVIKTSISSPIFGNASNSDLSIFASAFRPISI